MQDIEDIHELLADYWEESNRPFLLYSRICMVSNLARWINDEDSLVEVAEDKGRLIGVMVSELVNPAFSFDKVAENSILYVEKEYRGSLTGKKFISSYKKWAEEQGVKAAYIGTSSGINTERVKKFYSKLGFQEVGSDFQLRLEQ